MPALREPRTLNHFDYMRYAKRMEYTPGHFLAGSAMPTPTNEEAGFKPEDFTTSSLCHNYGDPRAIEALRVRFKVKPEQIAMTSGSSDANTLACLALLEPGDEVIVETPCYGSFNRFPELCHAKLVPLQRREKLGFLPDADEFKKLLTPKTRLVILANLHNPTGAFFPADLLKKIIKLAEANGAYVLVDEVYLDHMKPGTCDPTSFHYGGNVIVTSSLTKVYGFGTLRFGWMLAPEIVVERVLELQDLVSPELPAICQNLGLRVMKNIERMRAKARSFHERGLPIIKEWVKSRPDITLFEPAGGVIAALKIKGMTDTWDLADKLAVKYGVTIAPGAAFGMEGWIRVNIGKEPTALRAGLEALGKGIDAYRKPNQ